VHVELPRGWVEVSGESAAKLEEELRREVPRAHRLFGRDLQAVARRQDRDDVLFRSSDGGTFCVHLTWSVENDPKWPWTEAYRDLVDFLHRWPREELDDGEDEAG
jgi:hypothetical protein